MKRLRYGAAEAERPGMLAMDGTMRDLSAVVADIDGAAFAPATLAKLRVLDPIALPLVEGSPTVDES